MELKNTKIDDVLGGCFINNLTKELDNNLSEEYLLFNRMKHYICSMMIYNNERYYPIRFPGATRGGIVVDNNNIIIKIIINKDFIENNKLKIYNSNVINNINKFIGYKII